MKNVFLFLMFLSCCFNGLSQTIDSVKAEQVGELIKIHYKIRNSTSDQTFMVSIVCSINGGLNAEIKSTFGDIGEVRGGKKDYIIIWEVLKDVDELTSADFTVRAELIKEKEAPVVLYQVENIPQPAIKTDYFSHLFFVWAGSPNNGNTWGIRYGYMKKIGISAHIAFGIKSENDSYITEKHPLMHSGVDFATRLLSRKKTQIYLLTGVACAYNIGRTDDEPPAYKYSLFLTGIDLGTILDIGRFTSSLHIGVFPPIYNKTNIKPDFGALIGLGVGFRF